MYKHDVAGFYKFLSALMYKKTMNVKDKNRISTAILVKIIA